MKKLISLTLATIMIFSVPMSSFAEETQTSKTQDIVTVGVGVNRESQKTDSKIIEYDVGGGNYTSILKMELLQNMMVKMHLL